MEWGGLLGGIASGLFGYQGTKVQNVASAQQAEKAMAFSKAAQLRQMKFQERMSGSAHQRQMADMRKAGLNPILSAKYGGASSPAGSSAAGVAAPQYNRAQVALQNATTAANVQNIMANTAKTREETRKIAFKADISDAGSNIIDFVLDHTERGITNAKDIADNYFARENWFNPENYSFIESLIPRNERHPAAKKADRKYAKQKTRKIVSKHPRTRRRSN